MAPLTITALDDGGAPVAELWCLAWLSDLYGTPLREFTSGGLLVESVGGFTDIGGVCTLELVPNENVLRDNTYYTVKVGNRSPVLILKTSNPETLLEATAADPELLGAGATLSSLGDVNLSGLITGNALRYQGGQWIPWPWPSGGGGGGDKPWVTLSTGTVLLAAGSTNRYKADAAAGPFTITLPTAAGNMGIDIVIKRVNVNANNVTIGTTGSESIDGAVSFVLNEPWTSFTFSSDNFNWMVI